MKMFLDLKIVNMFVGKVICPFCGEAALFVPNCLIYGKSYGHNFAWVCRNFFERGTEHCDSYIGIHGSGEPLGTLANKETRVLRKQAHDEFDKTWDIHLQKGMNRLLRVEMYAKLAMFLGIPTRECHIGLFDAETCKRVLLFCDKYQSGEIPDYVKNPNNANPETSSDLWSRHVDRPIIQEGD